MGSNYLAQVAKVGELPPEAALVGNLRPLGARERAREREGARESARGVIYYVNKERASQVIFKAPRSNKQHVRSVNHHFRGHCYGKANSSSLGHLNG